MSKNQASLSLLQRIRLNFIYGLAVILPVFATVWLVLFFIEWITGPASTLIGPGVPKLFSFLTTLVFILMIGFFAKNYIGSMIIETVEAITSKIPIVGSIYQSSKQIVHAFSLQDRQTLKPVLLEYPMSELWALGFITQEKVSGLRIEGGDAFNQDKVAVFIPTTPNPTSGHFVYVTKEKLKQLDMTVEESIKLLMSAGVVNPGSAA